MLLLHEVTLKAFLRVNIFIDKEEKIKLWRIIFLNSADLLAITLEETNKQIRSKQQKTENRVYVKVILISSVVFY